MVIFAIIAAVAIIYVLSGFKIIQQSETRVIERLGRYNRTLSSGINIIWPILDKARSVTVRYVVRDRAGNNVVVLKESDVIDLREQVYDFPEQNVITKDNVTTRINALLYFQITDPVKSVYEIDNLPNAIEKLTQTTLRNVIGELELDETLTSRDTINSKLRAVLDDATNKWGVKVNRVELQDITPPDSVRKAMEQQMQAERERRAQILKSEGEKQSTILKSEGEKQSQVNEAEAEKQAQILLALGVETAGGGVAGDPLTLGEQAVDQVEDGHQIGCAAHEGIAVSQKHTLHTAVGLTGHAEILKDLLHGAHGKMLVVVHIAKSAAVVAAAVSDLHDQAVSLTGRTVYLS